MRNTTYLGMACMFILFLPLAAADHDSVNSIRDSLRIPSIRINGEIFPIVQPGGDLEITVLLESRSGLLAERLSARATLFDAHGAMVTQQNVLLKPFRRGKRSSINIILPLPTDIPSGTYDLRITLSAEDGRTRTRHRDVLVV